MYEKIRKIGNPHEIWLGIRAYTYGHFMYVHCTYKKYKLAQNGMQFLAILSLGCFLLQIGVLRKIQVLKFFISQTAAF